MSQFAKSSVFAVLCDSDGDDEHEQASSSTGKKKRKPKKKAQQEASVGEPVVPAKAPAEAPVLPKAAATQPVLPPPSTVTTAPVAPKAAANGKIAASGEAGTGSAVVGEQQKAAVPSESKTKTKKKAKKSEEGSVAHVAGNAFAALLLEDASVGQEAKRTLGVGPHAAPPPAKPAPTPPVIDKAAKGKAHEPPLLLDEWKAAGSVVLNEEEALERELMRVEKLAMSSTQQLMDDLGSPDLGYARKRILFLAIARQGQRDRLSMHNTSRSWHCAMKMISQELLSGGKHQAPAMEALGAMLGCGETRLDPRVKNGIKDVIQQPKMLRKVVELADAGEVSAVVALRDMQLRDWFSKKDVFAPAWWSDYSSDCEEDDGTAGPQTGRLASAMGPPDSQRLQTSLSGLAAILKGPRAGEERVRHACATRLKWLSDNVAPVQSKTPSAQSTTLAAALGSKAAPAPPPQALRVTLPDGVVAKEAIKKMDGVYVLTDKVESGYRTWKQQSGLNTIWMAPQGWVVGVFGKDHEILRSTNNRTYDDSNRLPHQQDGWMIHELGNIRHEPRIKVAKAADTTGAAKVERWVVHKNVKLMGLDVFRDHMNAEQARFKCLQLPWCEGYTFEDGAKPAMGEKASAVVVQAKFKKIWAPVPRPGWTSVHLEDPAAALADNSKLLGESSPWRSPEVLRLLMQFAGSFGTGGIDLVQSVLTPRPAAIANLAQSIERLPTDEVQVAVRILTQLSHSSTSGPQEKSVALPIAVHETMVKLASHSEGAKRTAMIAALATQQVSSIVQAGAVQAFLPQLSASAPVEETLMKLFKPLLSQGALDEVLRAGLLGQLHILADGEQELPLASLLESMVEADSEPWASVRPEWQGPTQELLRAVLQPKARIELQMAAVRLVPRVPSPALCELLVRIAEAGQPPVRIEALVAVLQVPLEPEVGARAAKVCASALKAPKEPVRARAAQALAEALRAKRLPAWLFGQVLLPELVSICEQHGSQGVGSTSPMGYAAKCLLEAALGFPDAVAAEHLGTGRGAAGVLAAAEAGALDLHQQAPMQVLRKAQRLDSAEVVRPRLLAWLQGEVAELKLLVARMAAQDVEDSEGLQRLLDSGLLTALFAMPRKLEESGTNNDSFTRLSRCIASVSITAVRKARRDQVQPIVDAGVCAWLCTALEVELAKIRRLHANFRPGRIYSTEDMRNRTEDADSDLVISEGIFVDIGDAILSVLQLGPEAEGAIVAAFTDVGTLRSELRSVLYRKDRPEVTKMSEQLLEKLISKQREQQLQKIFCKRCAETPQQCFRCKGAGYDTCFACQGNGKVEGSCKFCGGTGSWKDGKQCYRCKGKGSFSWKCNKCWGEGKWSCNKCHGTGKPYCKACESLRRGAVLGPKLGAEPKPGVKITQSSKADLDMLRKLWKEREGPGGEAGIEAAWNVDNPLLAWRQRKCVQEFKAALGKDPDEIRGFHGTAKRNVISIVENGFDAGKRSGQVFGAGEYFAKNPSVSVGYCHGDEYMLVCQLCLGQEASDPTLGNGDHIWVPTCKYYVIATPAQVVPLYIVRFKATRVETDLEQKVLNLPVWSTLEEAGTREIPPNRPAKMVAESTDLLWIGYLDPQVSDKQLQGDLQTFLDSHLPQDQKDRRVQVVRGRYTQAKVRLAVPLGREVVVSMCEKPFVENGKERTVTVDDGHGSPDMPCPRTIAQYCRGQNLRFVDPCWCWHKASPTATATYTTEPVDLKGAKADEIRTNFMQSAPFHTGMPRVVAINAIQNDTLGHLHDKYKAYLRDKNKEEPKILELYHGTNNMILDTLYTHGLRPPSDAAPAEDCPVSGGKRLCTSLCNNDCVKCVERHHWNRCHMYGLGIYLADLSQKSHRYVSEPIAEGLSKRFRMVLCSVAMGKVLELDGHLREGKCMHDVQSLRGLWHGDLEAKVNPAPKLPADAPPVEQHDLLFVKGLGAACRPGFSVHNSEFISFHPYQCLPRYEIVYEI